jgi:hypothetical protein
MPQKLRKAKANNVHCRSSTIHIDDGTGEKANTGVLEPILIVAFVTYFSLIILAAESALLDQRRHFDR